MFWKTLTDRRKKQSDWKTQVYHETILILVIPGSRENKSPVKLTTQAKKTS